MRIVAGLALLTAASVALRTGTLGSGYWIDEAIAVGIASHDARDIPALLRQDGSPPLHYLLLHGWMALGGTSEAATRSLSLLLAGLAVPVAWWAASAVAGRRAAWLAAAGAAGCPFLTYYAQEARMYSLAALLSIVVAAAFVLAVVHGGRRHLVTLAVSAVAVLYTHTWGVFLVAGLAVAWLALWRAGRVGGREGVLVGAAVALAYAPWVPSLLFQALHTAAPWAERPPLLYLLGVPGALFGYAAAPILVAAALRAGRDDATRRRASADASRRDDATRRRASPDASRRDDALRPLFVAAASGVALAWACAQVQPAWSPRYLAVFFGPVLLWLAAPLARGGRWTAVALAIVGLAWVVGEPTPARSNVRAATVGLGVRAGDLVISTQPEQVPVLHRYLPPGVAYLTPLGTPADPAMLDWRDALPRLRAGRASSTLLPRLRALPAGARVLLVTPVAGSSRAPWARAVRARTRGWRAAVRADPRLRFVVQTGRPDPGSFRSAVRTELYEVRSAERGGSGGEERLAADARR
jgi:mannosyltransferase